MGDVVAAGLSQQCFDVAERLEARQSLIDKLRLNFCELVISDSTPADVAALKSCPLPLLANILTMSASGLVDKVAVDVKCIDALCAVLRCSSEASDSAIPFHLVKNSPALVLQAQRGIVQSLSEKVWRSLDASVISKVLERLGSALPKNEIAFSDISEDSSEILGNGW